MFKKIIYLKMLTKTLTSMKICDMSSKNKHQFIGNKSLNLVHVLLILLEIDASGANL